MCQSPAQTWTASSEELPRLPAGPLSGKQTARAALGNEPSILLFSLMQNKIPCFTTGAETGVTDTAAFAE